MTVGWTRFSSLLQSCRQIFTSYNCSLGSKNTNKMSSRWEKAKATVADMTLEKKRTFYKCGDKFVQLSDILTWPAYALGKKRLPSPPANLGVKEDDRICQDPVLNDKVSLWRGDITFLEVDAIVNAANSSLLGGGGVDGAIHRAAGGLLYDECETLNGCPTGQAKITGGYKLPAKYVIHTVGPQGEYKSDLEKCYKNSFTLMLENHLKTIAFPCIATGIYGYPNEAAAHVALSVARDFVECYPEHVDRIIFTTFLEVDVKVYEKLLQLYFPVTLPPNEDSPERQSPQKNLSQSPESKISNLNDPLQSPESKTLKEDSPRESNKTSQEAQDSPQKTAHDSPQKMSQGSTQEMSQGSPKPEPL